MALQIQSFALDARASHQDSPRPHLALHKSSSLSCSPLDPLWLKALQAHENVAPLDCLSGVWQELLDGHLSVAACGFGASRHLIVARRAAPANLLKRIEIAVLVRVLCGDQQKVIAAELGIACSTTSKWYALALAKLNLDAAPIPLPLALAAQSWASGHPPGIEARSTVFEHDGCECFLLSIPRPSVRGPTCLTLAEQTVAKLLIEGSSRCDIAQLRATSAQTVACQLRGIFAKFHLTGRNALIRHAAALGWFH
jgi:DNA-binding NarL/FixJ family response regulator